MSDENGPPTIPGVRITSEEGKSLLRALELLQDQVSDQQKEIDDLRQRINTTETRLIQAITEALRGEATPKKPAV